MSDENFRGKHPLIKRLDKPTRFSSFSPVYISVLLFLSRKYRFHEEVQAFTRYKCSIELLTINVNEISLIYLNPTLSSRFSDVNGLSHIYEWTYLYSMFTLPMNSDRLVLLTFALLVEDGGEKLTHLS